MSREAIQRAFPQLGDAETAALEKAATRRSYPAQALLCREGEPGEVFFIIAEGQVEIHRRTAGDAEDLIVGTLGPGGSFGEMALITGANRSATVMTTERTETLEIHKRDFDQLLRSGQALVQEILEALIHMMRSGDEKAIAQLNQRNAALADAYRRLESAQADRIARAALEAQLEIAADAQRSLLPEVLPEIPGIEIATRFEPAKQIGGDFYDVRVLPDGSVGLLVADVSDKGAPAALFMAVAQTLYRAEQRHGREPADVARAVHEGLLETSSYEMFVTTLIGVLDPKAKSLRYVRCGHDEPLLVQPDGSTVDLGGSGRFLGMLDDPPPSFENREVVLRPGDVLLLFSDGVTDMQNPQGGLFGRERLIEVAREARSEAAREIADRIYSAVREHRAGAEAFDDFTLLVVRISP